jgi:predicted enzyme related to lactoylglutathione lyase
MITRVQTVTISVNDQQKALEFHRDNLGFKVLTDQPDGQNGRWLELQVPGGQTQIVLYPPVGESQRVGGFSNILFATDSVQKLNDELTARGVQVTVPPTFQPWGIFLQFKDIDGNEFLVSEASS